MEFKSVIAQKQHSTDSKINRIIMEFKLIKNETGIEIKF